MSASSRRPSASSNSFQASQGAAVAASPTTARPATSSLHSGPAATETSAPAKEQRTLAPPALAWNQRILVVEDEVGIADVYREILGAGQNTVIPLRRSSRSTPASPSSDTQVSSDSRGQRVADAFEVTVVHDATQALIEVNRALKAGKPFTMGFFDVLLGEGMDGIELVKQIRQLDPHMYAVFVTAYSDRGVDSIQSFLGSHEASDWDYLNKPFSQGEILQKARNGVALWNLRREKALRDDSLATLQRQLLEQERLVTMATVARGIGHEFRNILTSIIGKAELGANLNTSEQLKETLKVILSAGHKAADVLERFNHLHAPKDRIVSKKWMYAHTPIEEAIKLLSHQVKDHGVRICWIRKKTCFIHANSTALTQVFVNLLINSMHAMGSSGQVDISVAEIDKRIEIRFRDFGPGIKPEILDRVTEPFFTTKGDKGTGLGLAISKEIIEEEHGGKLQISNHEMKGLEVLITFPLVEKSPTGSEGGHG